ncbi:lipopolysaccharide assembly protein LapB [Vreelandella arcis]|uniref:Lipopolysaccharide assembly protein B n=1 Tax=Vreelandella arcis TaxID=416873 RepID=A0A1H0FZD4_9GAMM|nr:lipopolysaccharide assembly protein LapB [Halomonas arcis]SDO00016.1 Lipopolysaccharide biosynthesis regulator YciM, contains six TPR domains and a predicted metal-binding C-terminal domain [Halomonas arcis]
MLDITLLGVLFVAIAIGYGLGFRQASRRSDERVTPTSSGLSRDYFVGLNYLLNEQPDEAINTFINTLDVNSDTVETHITLGKLFRSRGEADKAVSIHQNLLARPALSDATNAKVQLELARDFVALGVHDRAQRLLRTLLDQDHDSDLRYPAKRLLIDLLEREKDWQSAFDTAAPLFKQYPNIRRAAAHWQCELAENNMENASRALAKRHLKKALQLDPHCVRANLLFADLEMDNARYSRAIDRLARIVDQDNAHLTTMVPALKRAYLRNDDEAGLERHLRQLIEISPYTSLIIELGELVHRRDGVDPAISVTGDLLSQAPSLRGLNYLVDLYIESQRLQGRSSPDTRLMLLKYHTEALLKNRPRHRCLRCGFTSDALQWQCPTCRYWGTIKPIIGVEGE